MDKGINKPDFIEKFFSVVWPEFVKTKDGLIFIRSEYINNNIDNLLQPWAKDKTELESFVNHIHICDVLTLRKTPSYKNYANQIGEMWVCKLKMEFPECRFRVYLTIDNDITLRFHQIHPEEPLWLNEEDWKTDISKGKIVIWQV